MVKFMDYKPLIDRAPGRKKTYEPDMFGNIPEKASTALLRTSIGPQKYNALGYKKLLTNNEIAAYYQYLRTEIEDSQGEYYIFFDRINAEEYKVVLSKHLKRSPTWWKKKKA
jgi:hypothetical protein